MQSFQSDSKIFLIKLNKAFLIILLAISLDSLWNIEINSSCSFVFSPNYDNFPLCMYFITLDWILRETENKMHRWSTSSMCTPKGIVPKIAAVLENILNWTEKLPRGSWATSSLLSQLAMRFREHFFLCWVEIMIGIQLHVLH